MAVATNNIVDIVVRENVDDDMVHVSNCKVSLGNQARYVDKNVENVVDVSKKDKVQAIGMEGLEGLKQATDVRLITSVISFVVVKTPVVLLLQNEEKDDERKSKDYALDLLVEVYFFVATKADDETSFIFGMAAATNFIDETVRPITIVFKTTFENEEVLIVAFQKGLINDVKDSLVKERRNS